MFGAASKTENESRFSAGNSTVLLVTVY